MMLVEIKVALFWPTCQGKFEITVAISFHCCAVSWQLSIAMVKPFFVIDAIVAVVIVEY